MLSHHVLTIKTRGTHGQDLNGGTQGRLLLLDQPFEHQLNLKRGKNCIRIFFVTDQKSNCDSFLDDNPSIKTLTK